MQNRIRIKINADGVEILTKKLFSFQSIMVHSPVQLNINEVVPDQNVSLTISNNFVNHTLLSDLSSSEIDLLHHRIQEAIEKVRNYIE